MGDLRAASDRLRSNPPPGYPGRPGRPRTRPAPAVTETAESPSAGTPRAHPTPQTRVNSGQNNGALARPASALQAVGPRLLDVHGAASYLSVSAWTIRDLIAAGKLRRVFIPGAKRVLVPGEDGKFRRVLIPGANGPDLRKVLIDRADLDGLIERWKETAP